MAHQRKSIYMIADVFWTHNIILTLLWMEWTKKLWESRCCQGLFCKCKLQNSSIRQTGQYGTPTTNVSPCTWLQMCFELTISFLTLLWMEWTKILWESSFWQGYFANVCVRILRYDNLVNVAHQRKSIYMIVDVFWTYNIISNITLDGMNKTLVESQLLTTILSKCKLQNSSIRQTDQPGATT